MLNRFQGGWKTLKSSILLIGPYGKILVSLGKLIHMWIHRIYHAIHSEAKFKRFISKGLNESPV